MMNLPRTMKTLKTPAEALLSRLSKQIEDGKIMFGHQDSFLYGHSWKIASDATDFNRTDIEDVAGVYPAGIHGCIKNFLSSQEDMCVRTATLAQRKCGLSDEVLENTDVLIWWGHMAHDKVPDKIVEKIIMFDNLRLPHWGALF